MIMQVEIDFNKSIESNASSYYDKGKEAKGERQKGFNRQLKLLNTDCRS